MPKKPIDYSNTIVYMLCCKDPTITDVYVGHTTNLPKRKASHKSRCNNPKCGEYNMYVYQFIRENGGWENWEMIVLETASCVDGDDARKLEREWFEKKGASLNKYIPLVTEEEQSEKNKIYHQEHKDEISERKKIYRQEHKDELNIKKKIYTQEHKDQKREYDKNRKALKKLQKEAEVKISL